MNLARTCARQLVVLLFLGFLCSYVSSVHGAVIYFEDSWDLVNTSGEYSTTVRTALGDSLKIRDPDTGIDSIIPNDGDIYGCLLGKYITDGEGNIIGLQFGGNVNSDNSAHTSGLYPGHVQGSAWDGVFPDGSSVDYLLPYRDSTSDSVFAMSDNGQLSPAGETIFYPGIEIDGTYPGELGFPAITYTHQEVIINHPVILQEISEIPEPTSILLLCSGLLSLITFMRRNKSE